MRRKNFHIYSLFSDIKSIPYILLIPVCLNFILNDISILTIIILYCLCILMASIIIYLKFYSYINKNISQIFSRVRITSGIFIKKESIFDVSKVCSISSQQTFIAKLIGAYKTFINFHKTDNLLKKGIYLNKYQVSALIKCLFGKSSYKIIYKINIYKMIILSISYHNIISGIIIATPLIKKTRNLLKHELKFQYIISSTKLYDVSSVIINILYLSILLFFVVFLVEIIKFWGLTVYKSKHAIYLKKGFLSTTFDVINMNHICAISYRSTLINIISKTKLVYLHTLTDVLEHSVILASLASLSEVEIFNELIDYNPKNEIFKMSPTYRTFINHLYFPISIYLLGLIFSVILPYYIKIVFVIIMSILIFWILFIRIYSFKRSRIILHLNLINLTSYSGLSLVNVIIKLSDVRKIKIKQSIFQILSKRCDVYFYSHSSSKKIFKIRHVNMYNVENLVETLENIHIKSKKLP